MAKNGKGALRLYRSYMFKDKDPIIDRLKTMISDEGLTYSEVRIISGVSSTTLYNWFEGETRRPQFASIAAVAYSMGYKQDFVRTKEINYPKEIEKAKQELIESGGKWSKVGGKRVRKRAPKSDRSVRT